MDRARRRRMLDAPLSPASPTATTTAPATAASATTTTPGANGSAVGSSSVTFAQILVISAFSVGVVAAMLLGPRLVTFLWGMMRSPEERRRRAMLAAAAERTRLHAQESVPLSSGVLEKLPKLPFILDTPDSHPADFDRTCAVCLMEYEEGEELLSLPCSHRFHFDCVSLWFLSHCTCPTCRLCLNAAEKQDAEHETGMALDVLEQNSSEAPNAGIPDPGEGGKQEAGASTLIVEKPSTDIPVVHRGVPEEDVDLLVPGNMSVSCDALKHDELKDDAGAVEFRLVVEEEGNEDAAMVMEEDVQNLRPQDSWNEMPRCLEGSGKFRQ